MKKLLLVLSLALISLFSSAQDTVVLKHNAFTSVFSKSAHIPVVVKYTLHFWQVQCPSDQKIERLGSFHSDPLLAGTNLSKDYAKSGYDCGHNMSAQDNACSSLDMFECFSYTNMFPQEPNLNRGIWKKLEENERLLAKTEDSVQVFIGSYGVSTTIGKDNVHVPKYCWKAIYIFHTDTWLYYSFPNNLGYDYGKSDPTDYPAPDNQLPWIRYCIQHFFQ